MANRVVKIVIDVDPEKGTAGIKKVDGELAKLGNTVVGTDGKLRDLGSTAKGNVNNALFNLSALIEDSAYGFRGMANNMPLVIRDFQRLSTEVGGAGAAIKTLAGGLMGPAGFIMGISMLSSLVITFGDDIVEAFTGGSDAVDGMSEEMKELAEDIADVIRELNNMMGAAIYSELQTRQAMYRKQQEELMAIERQLMDEYQRLASPEEAEKWGADWSKVIAFLRYAKGGLFDLNRLLDERDEIQAQMAVTEGFIADLEEEGAKRLSFRIAQLRDETQLMADRGELTEEYYQKLKQLEALEAEADRRAGKGKKSGASSSPTFSDELPVDEQTRQAEADYMLWRRNAIEDQIELSKLQQSVEQDLANATLRNEEALIATEEKLRQNRQKATEEHVQNLHRQRQAEEEALQSFMAGVAMRVESYQDLFGAVRQAIKAYLAEAVAGALAKEFGTKGLVGAITGALAAGAVGMAFEALVPKFATGGLVIGPGGPRDDRILARLSRGEYVVNAEATRRNLSVLNAINNGGSVAVPGMKEAIDRLNRNLERGIHARFSRESFSRAAEELSYFDAQTNVNSY